MHRVYCSPTESKSSSNSDPSHFLNRSAEQATARKLAVPAEPPTDLQRSLLNGVHVNSQHGIKLRLCRCEVCNNYIAYQVHPHVNLISHCCLHMAAFCWKKSRVSVQTHPPTGPPPQDEPAMPVRRTKKKHHVRNHPQHTRGLVPDVCTCLALFVFGPCHPGDM